AGRFRRVIFEEYAERAVLQRMDDSFEYCMAAIDAAAGTVSLTGFREGQCQGKLHYRREGDRLSMEGTLNGRVTRVETRLMDRSRFPLLRRGFHWIQEKPFNR
ncbi:MAG: hypothetical protein JNK48_01095, partial [Bryobacterales bacterium]|nr:hypothetical protein [Bryobacterales bacterium]